jgi:hypothetical protein
VVALLYVLSVEKAECRYDFFLIAFFLSEGGVVIVLRPLRVVERFLTHDAQLVYKGYLLRHVNILVALLAVLCVDFMGEVHVALIIPI